MTRRRVSVVWIAMLVGLAAGLAGAEPLRIYVAPQGLDTNAGTAQAPYATLERARDEIRRRKQAGGLPPGGVIVALRGGSYFQARPLVLEERDSGTATAPVSYTADGREPVRLTGAKQIGKFAPTTDPAVLSRLPAEARGHVLQTDLKAQGITDYGTIGVQTRQSPQAGLELFCGGRPMTLARWPNAGLVTVAGAPKGEKGGAFAYSGDRPSRWLAEPDARANGYWDFDWASSNVAFAQIDPATHIITTKPPHANYGYRKGGRWFAYNLLSELDQPGEWYLDRGTGILYFWPPADLARTTVEVSVGSGFLVLNKASYISFRKLTFEGCRGEAVTIRDGSHVELVGCTLRNLGTRAVTIAGGSDHRVAGCDFYDVNEGAIACSGGDRATLTPARHVVENCLFTRLSRWQRTYAAAVDLYGVGCRASHNLMYDIPHIVLLYNGNDHVIEGNEVHSVGYENGEMGAFYCGRNWTMSGNVIRDNYLHDIYNPCPQRNRAFMLDDGVVGTTMTGNIIVRVAEGISLSSLWNVIDNNVFVDCHPAIGCWGGEARFPPFDPQAGHNPTMWPPLEKLALDQPPWSTRYPDMLPMREAIRTGGPVPPQLRTRITHNVVWQGDPEWTGFHMTKDKAAWVIADNLVGQDPQFVDAAKGDYRLKRTSPAFKLGIKPVATTRAGVQPSPDRASWPVKHEVRADMTRNFVYAAPPKAPKDKVKPVTISRLTTAPAIDGAVREAEWPGQPVMIERDADGDVVHSPSRAWLGYDDQALYVAFSNPINATSPPALDSVWGKSEAVEIAVRPITRQRRAIVVLRGYATGKFESSAEAGAPAPVVKQAAEGVKYAAKQVNASLWTCTWRIPWASLGVEPAKTRQFAANLTVRKVADNLWVMWAATGGRSWELGQAGEWGLGG